MSHSAENEVSLPTPPFKNSLLKALDADTIQRLRLRPIVLELKHEIEYPSTAIRFLLFIEEGMASMTTAFCDGSEIEVGMFGYESVIGMSALMGSPESLNRVCTQIAGSGYFCSIEVARKEFGLCGAFQALALRYVQAQLIQSAQSIGCNAKHNLDERLARWLLLCADRARKNTFMMSHEFLAEMLGSSRPTLSIAAAVLKKDGLIEYSRGVISILDAAGLEKRSCECYQIIKHHLDHYAHDEGGIATCNAVA